MSNPWGSTIPGGGQSPLPFISGSANVPAGPMPELRRSIQPIDMGDARGHLHYSESDWVIPSLGTVFLAPYPRLNYDRLVTAEELVWYIRAPLSAMPGKRANEYNFVSHYSFNDVCRRGWIEANKTVLPELEAMRQGRAARAGAGAPGAHIDEDRSHFVKYLTMPEHRWRPLFGPTSTLYAQDDHYRTLAYLCKEGILARWAPIGNVLTQPEVQYGPTETPRKGSRMQISLSYEGVTHVPNIWGERACHCAHLFEILKRYRDPVSGEYTHFASVPYASMEKTVPLKELQYVGVGGTIETGVAFLRGRVMEVLGEPANGDHLLTIQGLRGTAAESHHASNNTSRLKIMQISPSRLS